MKNQQLDNIIIYKLINEIKLFINRSSLTENEIMFMKSYIQFYEKLSLFSMDNLVVTIRNNIRKSEKFEDYFESQIRPNMRSIFLG